MKYTPGLPPEGINTSTEHPLKEFAILLLGIGGLIAAALVVLSLSIDYLINFVPPEAERKLFRISPPDALLAQNDPETQRVRDYLAARIAQINHAAERAQDVSIDVVVTEQPNAFVIPGGRIYVTTGLLELLESENGLTMVLAHEWAHQRLRHPIKGLGKGMVIAAALAVVSGTQDSAWMADLLGGAVQIGMLAYSREQESDADALGLALTTRIYGHSNGADEFFAKMIAEESSSNVPTFLRSHPPTEQRLQRIAPHARGTTSAITPLPEFVKDYAAQRRAFATPAPQHDVAG